MMFFKKRYKKLRLVVGSNKISSYIVNITNKDNLYEIKNCK